MYKIFTDSYFLILNVQQQFQYYTAADILSASNVSKRYTTVFKLQIKRLNFANPYYTISC